MRYLVLSVFVLSFITACDSTKPVVQVPPQTFEPNQVKIEGPVDQFKSWLIASGLGKGLVYVRHDFEQDQRLILNLGFRGEKKSAKAVWDNLQAGFNSSYGESLREALYRKAIFYFHGEPEKTEVLILDSYDASITPCLAISIFSNEYNELDGDKDACLSETYELELSETYTINRSGAYAEVFIDANVPTDYEALWQSVISNLESYYSAKQAANNSNYKMQRFLEGEPHLNLMVKNIQNEVLSNSTKKDQFEMHLLSLKIVEENNGGKLILYLDASYGEGPWREAGGEYQSMEMAFKDELNEYCQQFLRGPLQEWVLAGLQN